MWECPVTKKLYKTEAEAARATASAKAAKTRKAKAEKLKKEIIRVEVERANYLINNATSIKHLFQLVREKSDEFWGIKFTHISVSSINTREKHYHSDRPGPVLEFRLRLEAENLSSQTVAYIKKYRKIAGIGSVFDQISGLSIRSLFDKTWCEMGIRFNGVRTGTGCGGRWGSSALSMDAYIYIEDFPKIAERYKTYVGHKQDLEEWGKKEKLNNQRASCFARTTKEYRAQAIEVNNARAELEYQSNLLDQLKTRGEVLFKQITQDELGPCPEDATNSCYEFEVGDIIYP